MKNILKSRFSLIVSGTGNNNHCAVKGGEETEFISKYKPRVCGKLKISLLYFNRIYSTGCGEREKQGDCFTITSAYIGYGSEKSKKADIEVPVTFNGSTSVFVDEGYCSDEAELDIPEGAWLFVRLNVYSEKDCILPSTDECASGGYRNGLRTLNVLRPNLILCDRKFDKTLVFFGDSITQGTRTAADKYEAWTHRTAFAQPLSTNVLNLGMGWSRAYDAAADGIFMNLAKNADEITICFGVNDIKSGRRTAEEIIGDLKRIICLLKENNPRTKAVLFTVPPFNMEPWEESQRQIVNKEILSGAFDAEVFDCGKILEAEEGRVRPEFMADSSDSHPNGKAGEALSAELLKSGIL